MASHWLCWPPLFRQQVVLIRSPSESQASEERWRPGSGPAALTCFPGHPLPPCVEAAKPVPLPPVAIATGRPLLPELPAPAPGRLS